MAKNISRVEDIKYVMTHQVTEKPPQFIED